MTAEGIWGRVQREATSSSARATVDGLQAVDYRDGVLVIDDASSRSVGISHTQREALERLVERVLGRAVKVEVRGGSNQAVDPSSTKPMENHPDVRMVLKEFDAMVVEVDNSATKSLQKGND